MTEEMNTEMLEDFVYPKMNEVYTGTVMKVDREEAFIHIGSKQEVILPQKEAAGFFVEDLREVLQVGDQFEVVVIQTKDGVKVSKIKLENQRKWEDIKQKYAAGERVNAQIREVVKGGLIADIGLRAFIPASMISNHFVKDLKQYIGQELQFQIVELDEKKNKIILSRRELLIAEEQQKKKTRLSEIHVGDILEGTVNRLTNFGAFVDLGGIDGLLHVSQLSYEKVTSLNDIVQIGQPIKVKVIHVDPETKKVGLSLKALQTHPWIVNSESIRAGQVLEGTVVKFMDFGAFVELAPHVEGLLHVSQISEKPVKKPTDASQMGQKVTVKVRSIDRASRKISLSMVEVQKDLEKAEIEKYKAQLNEEHAHVSLGDVFGDMLKDLR